MDHSDQQQLPQVAPEVDLEQLFDAGAHFGHQVKRWNPKMAEYIFGKQNGVHLFDLEKTAAQLQLAYNTLYKLGQEQKQVIFVGTKRQARELIKEQAAKHNLMQITARWLGGLLTNWQQVSKSLKRMLKIEAGFARDEFKLYTKYEQVQLEKERARLARFFDGIRELKGAPDAIFVIDPVREDNAVSEANKMGVPVIALADSDADPSKLEIVIPANDDAHASIAFVLELMVEAYTRGRKEAKARASFQAEPSKAPAEKTEQAAKQSEASEPKAKQEAAEGAKAEPKKAAQPKATSAASAKKPAAKKGESAAKAASVAEKAAPKKPAVKKAPTKKASAKKSSTTKSE